MSDETTMAWRPELSETGPRFRALADAIADAVASGGLQAGAKLPPVRDLAWSLKVTPGTVARAYRLAESRGLVEGQVGRGTFVRDPDAPAPTAYAGLPSGPAATDLRGNQAVDVGQDSRITAALNRLIDRWGGALPLTAYHRFGADRPERESAAEWLRLGGVPARVDDLLLTSGAQIAVSIALAAVASGRDAVALCEPLIHPGLKDAARTIGVRLEPVAADEEGLLPDALDAASERFRPSVVLLTVNLQNPTLATASEARRVSIARVAENRGLAIIEDDVYGWPGDRLDGGGPPSLAELAPDRTWYVASLSKCVAAGLRAGFLMCPRGQGRRGAHVMQGLAHHTAWLNSALAAALVESGDAEAIAREVSVEFARRTATTRDALGRHVRVRDGAAMAWLELPEPWRASEFAVAAEAAGVLVAPAELYAPGRAPAPHAVRLGLGCPADSRAVARATKTLADLLRAGPPPADAPA